MISKSSIRVPLMPWRRAVLLAGLSNSTHALLDSVLMDFVPQVKPSTIFPCGT